MKSESSRDTLNRQCLRKTGHPLKEYMSSGKQGDKDIADKDILTDYLFSYLFTDIGNTGSNIFNGNILCYHMTIEAK